MGHTGPMGIPDIDSFLICTTLPCFYCMAAFVCMYDACVQFCQLSRDGEAYHDYCLNYSKAMSYLEQLRKKEDFCEFEKVMYTTFFM